MSRSISVVGSLVVAASAFIAGALTAAYRDWGHGDAVVNIANVSHQSLSGVVVHFQTCGGSGTVGGADIGPGKTIQVWYHLCGEGAHFVEATFTSGKILRSEEVYVENGSRTAASVSTDAVSLSPP